MNLQVAIPAATNTRFARISENARYVYFRNVGTNPVNVTYDGSAASATLGETYNAGDGRSFETNDGSLLAVRNLNAYSALGTTISVGTDDAKSVAP